jgi:hypothetical protein
VHSGFGTYDIVPHVSAVAGVLDNYQLFVGHNGTLTINPRPITLKANSVSRVYGDSTPAFSIAAFAGSFAAGEDASNLGGTPSFDSGAPATGNQPVGGYPITLSGLTSANYTISYATSTDRGTLTITRRPLAITASSPADIVVASAAPTVTAIYGASFAPGENANSLTTKPSCGTTYTTLSPVGTYPTSCSGAVSPNYTFTYATGSFKAKFAASGTTCSGDAGHVILQPINPDGTSVFKGGSTVPAKFRVCDASGVSIGAPGTVKSFKLSATITGLVSSTVDDGTVTSTTPDNAFRWSATDQQWIFNINTKGMATNKTYVYVITLNDDSTIQFQFGLK